MYSTQHSTIFMGTKIIKKLEFKNPDIFKHQSDFTGKDGNQLKRVYTSFKMKKTTAFRGLCLCEYFKGEKHFVIRFYLKGQRKKPEYDLAEENLEGSYKGPRYYQPLVSLAPFGPPIIP